MAIPILGPFIGHTTDSSTKIWLRNKDGGKATICLYKNTLLIGQPQTIEFLEENLWSAIASFNDLLPDTEYTYQIFKGSSIETKLTLEIDQSYQKIRTMPKNFEWEKYRYDFLLMSCNNPDQCIDTKNKRDGYEVWETIPTIIKSHENENREARVLFALMGGDQIYSDKWSKQLLELNSTDEKVKIYLEIYEHYWSDLRYRKVLASLPAYLMWDDHDIIDGWGSETSSFTVEAGKTTSTFKPEWQSMFVAAKRAFNFYQASRNPDPLIPYSSLEKDTFDIGFKVGPLGFIMADLRSNRNWQNKIFWTDSQVKAVERWVNENKQHIEVLFFLTPVVIAHGSPTIEEGLVKNWDLVLKFFKHARDSKKNHHFQKNHRSPNVRCP